MKKSAGVQTTPSISGQHSAVKFNAINNAQENPTKPRQRYEFVNVDGPNGSRLPRLVPVPDDYVIGTGEPAAADLQGKKELLDK